MRGPPSQGFWPPGSSPFLDQAAGLEQHDKFRVFSKSFGNSTNCRSSWRRQAYIFVFSFHGVAPAGRRFPLPVSPPALDGASGVEHHFHHGSETASSQSRAEIYTLVEQRCSIYQFHIRRSKCILVFICLFGRGPPYSKFRSEVGADGSGLRGEGPRKLSDVVPSQLGRKTEMMSASSSLLLFRCSSSSKEPTI